MKKEEEWKKEKELLLKENKIYIMKATKAAEADKKAMYDQIEADHVKVEDEKKGLLNDSL